MYVCAWDTNLASFYDCSIGFRTVLTVWYVSGFHFIHIDDQFHCAEVQL
jgi:hypothetical protein